MKTIPISELDYLLVNWTEMETKMTAKMQEDIAQGLISTAQAVDCSRLAIKGCREGLIGVIKKYSI